MMRAALASLCVLHLASAVSAAPRTSQVSTNRLKKEPFSDGLLRRLRVPSGFTVSVVAKELAGARMLAVAPDGVIYITRPSKGDVRPLRDENGDGKADSQEAALSGLDGVHGIALRGEEVFLGTPQEL